LHRLGLAKFSSGCVGYEGRRDTLPKHSPFDVSTALLIRSASSSSIDRGREIIGINAIAFELMDLRIFFLRRQQRGCVSLAKSQRHRLLHRNPEKHRLHSIESKANMRSIRATTNTASDSRNSEQPTTNRTRSKQQ